MTNQIINPNDRKYDLRERTAKFGESIIMLLKTIAINPINRPLVDQLVRSSTSIGANYMEADGAESKKDFRHKIAICKKEAMETQYWLQMLAKTNPEKQEALRKSWKEVHELTLIFAAILRSAREKS